MINLKRPRLIEVAKRASVSPATVSRVLIHPELVNDATRSRVRKVIVALGYRPNGMARALSNGQSRTVGFIVPTLDNAIFSRALQSMQTTLASSGYHLLVASSNYNQTAETEAIRALLERGIDALVLVGAERARDAESLVAEAGIPIIVTWVEHDRWPSIIIDNRQAGRLATEHLLALGHRRIGVISLPVQHNDRQRQRVEGLRQALADAGLSLPDAWALERSTTAAGGRSGCAALLQMQIPPTAIVCCVDYQAVGAMIEVQARGLQVPQDISIVGIDNLELGEHLMPPLTTVLVPTGAIGERAALQIIGRLSKQTMPQREVLPIELVVRQSTAAIHHS
ncbi:MAG: LacI family transcriptional regulator [Alphaproteobacteria bacterium]|nr:LacI family transcriptional regulator [Alphaproteobacteria bacterium]